MENKIKRKWRVAENYHSQEFYLEDDYLLHKNWFDLGKNPTKNKISFDEILSGKQDYHFLLNLELKPWIFREIKENIKAIIKRNENK